MVLEPLLAPAVDDGHEVAPAVVGVVGVGTVVEVALVEDQSDESVLAGGFGVLQGFEPELVVDLSLVEDVVEELVLDLDFAVKFAVCMGWILRLTDW